MIKSFSLLIMVTIVLLAQDVSYADDLNMLPYLKFQERSNWCWAAAVQGILGYNESPIQQCNAVDTAFGYRGTSSSCLTGSFGNFYEDSPYNKGLSSQNTQIVLSKFGINSNARGRALTQAEYADEINAGRPVYIHKKWGTPSNIKGGHALVGYGYQGMFIDYWDPWIDGGGRKSILYTSMLNSPTADPPFFWGDTVTSTRKNPPGWGNWYVADVVPADDDDAGYVHVGGTINNPGNAVTQVELYFGPYLIEHANVGPYAGTQVSFDLGYIKVDPAYSDKELSFYVKGLDDSYTVLHTSNNFKFTVPSLATIAAVRGNGKPLGVKGVCGTANGQSLSIDLNAYPSMLCSAGNPANLSENFSTTQNRFTWTCLGDNGESSASCTSIDLRTWWTISVTGSGKGCYQHPDWGTVCPDSNTGAIVAPGTQITFTASGQPNSVFTDWSSTPWGLCSGKGACTIQASPTGGKIDLYANFEKTFQINFTTDNHGRLIGDTSQTIINNGTSIGPTADPAPGYQFLYWTGPNGVISVENPPRLTNITADQTITANFTTAQLMLVFYAGTGGSLTGTTEQTVSYNGSATAVTAVPATGYHFVDWFDGNDYRSNNNPLTLTNVTSNRSLLANFAINQYPFYFGADLGGSMSGNSAQTVSYNGSTTAVTAMPQPGYHFVNWAGMNGFLSTANPLVVDHITATDYVVAHFDRDQYAVTFAAGVGGSLTGATSQSASYNGSTTAVTAVPASGYHFVNWTGPNNFQSAANPLTLNNVTATQTITANFAIDQLAVNFTAGPNGSLTGTTSQTVSYNGTATPVTAVPASGYYFVNWTGPNNFQSAANPLTLNNVTSAQTITANFASNQVTVTFAAGPNGSLTGTTSQTISYNSSTTPVTAVPASGYYLVNWSGPNNFQSTANPLTLNNVTSVQTITANFAKTSGTSDGFIDGSTLRSPWSLFWQYGNTAYSVAASAGHAGNPAIDVHSTGADFLYNVYSTKNRNSCSFWYKGANIPTYSFFVDYTDGTGEWVDDGDEELVWVETDHITNLSHDGAWHNFSLNQFSTGVYIVRQYISNGKTYLDSHDYFDSFTEN